MKIFSINGKGCKAMILPMLCSLASFGQKSIHRLEITPLTGDFYIYTTYGSYKGSPVPANGMYVVTTGGVILFDTPWDSTQFQPLLDSIQARHHQTVTLCIATHFHADRTGGLEYYRQKGIPTYTTKLTDDISKIKNSTRAEHLIYKDSIFVIGQYSFQTYYGGAGHSTDNIVVWFDREKILYGGCLIKSTDATDLGNLSDASVREWGKTINKIQRKFKDPLYIIPGHGSWQSRESLNHTLELVQQYKPEK